MTADDVAGAHHLRVNSRHGIIDIMRGGLPPLDYETAAARAVEVDVGGTATPFASLLTLVGFKRLADRGQDRLDLENLERVNRRAADRADPRPRSLTAPAPEGAAPASA